MVEQVSLSIRVGATYPDIQVCINDQYDNVYDLSDVSAATFTMYNSDGTVIDGESCTLSTDDDGNDVVVYSWQSGDTDEAGSYYGYFTLTFSSGGVMIAPSSNTFTIEVWDVD